MVGRPPTAANKETKSRWVMMEAPCVRLVVASILFTSGAETKAKDGTLFRII